jgi:hypothetical protein
MQPQQLGVYFSVNKTTATDLDASLDHKAGILWKIFQTWVSGVDLTNYNHD